MGYLIGLFLTIGLASLLFDMGGSTVMAIGIVILFILAPKIF